ncbi:hypothetical protein [Bacteroides sp. UBA939]|uniref:hypothetical protein n=1 Tax=Bacteroides sp. UBA939 TaxID=1946092 RepID=UPI0025BF32DD|nr:hypothetical protein [Bacteroides sp. UBA939]
MQIPVADVLQIKYLPHICNASPTYLPPISHPASSCFGQAYIPHRTGRDFSFIAMKPSVPIR